MSRRALLCAGVLVFGVPLAGQAQGIPELQAIRARLQHEADSLQAVRRAGPPMDTVRLAGGWTLVVSPAARPLAEQEVAAALAEVGREFGGVVTPADGPVRVTFDTLSRLALQVSFVGGGPMATSAAFRLEPGTIKASVEGGATGAAWHHADVMLQRWAGAAAIGLPFDEVAPAARVRLARDTGAAVLGCRHGDVAACERALAGPAGVSEVVRTSLFRFALERAGGARRLGELYADPSRPMLDRLAALAGEPRDALVSEWRERLIGLGALNAHAVLTAALGALILAGLGIWGVRWRHV